MKKSNCSDRRKLPAAFANVVYDDNTGQMLDYKKLINHNKKDHRKMNLENLWKELDATQMKHKEEKDLTPSTSYTKNKYQMERR